MNRNERRRIERSARNNPAGTFANRWRNVTQRLQGKNITEGELFVEPIDDHLSVVVLTLHTECLEHLPQHLLEAASWWMDAADKAGEA